MVQINVNKIYITMSNWVIVWVLAFLSLLDGLGHFFSGHMANSVLVISYISKIGECLGNHGNLGFHSRTSWGTPYREIHLFSKAATLYPRRVTPNGEKCAVTLRCSSKRKQRHISLNYKEKSMGNHLQTRLLFTRELATLLKNIQWSQGHLCWGTAVTLPNNTGNTTMSN